jgi:hypothetical protein
MKNGATILTAVVVGILACGIIQVYAQIGQLWQTQQNDSVFEYLGGANMDSDPQDELVYYMHGNYQRIVIYDGATGNIDWDSGNWQYIEIAGYGNGGYTHGSSPFFTMANGRKGITFRGYAGGSYRIYAVGQGGGGVAPEGNPGVPQGIQLFQNYPNPFNPDTRISYDVAKPDRVTIKIYNELGQEVRQLVDELKTAGQHTVSWDGTDNSGNSLATGMYFYQLKVGDHLSAKKMVMLR